MCEILLLLLIWSIWELIRELREAPTYNDDAEH